MKREGGSFPAVQCTHVRAYKQTRTLTKTHSCVQTALTLYTRMQGYKDAGTHQRIGPCILTQAKDARHSRCCRGRRAADCCWQCHRRLTFLWDPSGVPERTRQASHRGLGRRLREDPAGVPERTGPRERLTTPDVWDVSPLWVPEDACRGTPAAFLWDPSALGTPRVPGTAFSVV